MDWNRLRQKLLEKFYPEENEINETEEMYSEISNYIKKEFAVETKFCGSTARKTFMTGDKDIDIFLLFDKEIERNELEEKGLKIGKKVFEKFEGEYQKEYADHPYSKGTIEVLEVEIVPCYDTKIGKTQSSVDRTPHHTEWCLENLNKKEREDVVLLKSFLTANNLYGSSLKNKGFSGYLCEILISKYGGFKELIEQAQNWNKEKVIDIENHHEGALPTKLKEKFHESNLIVIDPTDPERNVASVLSSENYAKFTYNSIKFNEKPGLDKFEEDLKNFTTTEIKKEIDDRGQVTVIEFPKLDKVDDILYPQMRKTIKRITKIIKENDFVIYQKGFHVSESKIRIYFETIDNLPDIKQLKGPAPFHGKKHVLEFEQKYSNTWIKGERLRTKVERDHTRIKQLLKSKITRNQEKLRKNGIPEDIAGKIEEYRFVNPVQNDQQWLNYLGQQFNIDNQ